MDDKGVQDDKALRCGFVLTAASGAASFDGWHAFSKTRALWHLFRGAFLLDYTPRRLFSINEAEWSR